MAEVGLRWRLKATSMRQVVRDGWLTPVSGLVLLQDVQDLEEMGMPAKWRLREASSQRPRLTPHLDPETIELPSVETVMRRHGVGRSRAYLILAEMRDTLP